MKLKEESTPDIIIIFIIITLLCFGLVMILSASSIRAYSMYGDSYYFFKRQLVSAVVGVFAMLVFMNIDYKFYRKYAKFILLMIIFALTAVLIPGIGQIAGGSRRWIDFGIIGVQPSELAKLGIIVYVARFISDKKEKIDSFVEGLLPLLIVISIIFALILLEPDLGTAVAIAGTFFIILFIAGININYLFFLGTGGLALIIAFIFIEGYRRERFFAFLNPWSDPLDTGYHIIQSLLALGSGGIFGVGLGNSKQKFLYLPEPGTDFIFSILGEEFGLLGTIVILLLYFILAWRGLKIAVSVTDTFASILAAGITIMIVLQAVINIGVVTASMPITGITLPFISYGGTSLVIMLSGIGILLNISRKTIK